jgi:hypothetical protein
VTLWIGRHAALLADSVRQYDGAIVAPGSLAAPIACGLPQVATRRYVPGMPQDPMAMARAMQSIMAQAAAWVAAYKTDLAGRGLGFTPEDLTAISAAATAHPLPPGHESGTPTAADIEAAQRVQAQVAATVFPEAGFAPDDPRLAPNGMPLVAWAVAARAIGWATEDSGLVERVLAALGHTRADYDAATAHWTPMLTSDMAVATLYGQLFANAAELPLRPTGGPPR